LLSVGGTGTVEVLGDVDGPVGANGAEVVVEGDDALGGAGDPDASLASRALSAIALFVSFLPYDICHHWYVKLG
jgi:hypothetical protein